MPHALRVSMLSVKYGADIPQAVIDVLEHHARHAGLSLEALEIVGSSLDFAEAFIVAAEDGEAQRFADGVLGVPTDKVERARWQAARLFGDEATA